MYKSELALAKNQTPSYKRKVVKQPAYVLYRDRNEELTKQT